MNLWSSLKRAFGFGDAHPAPDAPPALTAGARARLAALPEGHGIFVSLVPWEDLALLRVVEGPADPPHPGFAPAPVACADETFERLRGLAIDHDGQRWRLQAEVQLRARGTPNPDGRLYVADRPLAEGHLFFGEGADPATLPRMVRQILERDDVRSVLVRGDTLTVESVPGVPWDPIDRAVAVAVREHVLGAGGVLRRTHAPVVDEGLAAEVWAVLESEVLPALHRDGGDLQLLGVEDGVVRIHLVGACRTCPASTLTVKGGIERALKQAFPGRIAAVENVDP